MIPSQDKGGGYGIKEVVAYIIYEYIDHISEIEDFINKNWYYYLYNMYKVILQYVLLVTMG